jgi:hypothetical protein
MRPLEQRRRVPQRGHRITQQLNPLVAAVRKSSCYSACNIDPLSRGIGVQN